MKIKYDFINSWKAHVKKQGKATIEIRIAKLTIFKLAYSEFNMYVHMEQGTPETFMSKWNNIKTFSRLELMLFNLGLNITYRWNKRKESITEGKFEYLIKYSIVGMEDAGISKTIIRANNQSEAIDKAIRRINYSKERISFHNISEI